MKPSGGTLVGRVQQKNEPNQVQIFASNPVLEFRPKLKASGSSGILARPDETGTTDIQSFLSTKDAGGMPPTQLTPPQPAPAAPLRSGLEKKLIQAAVEAEPMAREFAEAVSSGNRQQADKIFKQMLRKYPNAPQTLALRIAQAHSLGDMQSARQLYEKLKTYPLPESAKSQMEDLGERIYPKK
jgi:hypothetical protein